MLYRADLLKEDGQLDEAIAHLEANQSFVVDQLSWKLKMAELTLSLGMYRMSTDRDCHPLLRFFPCRGKPALREALCNPRLPAAVSTRQSEM